MSGSVFTAIGSSFEARFRLEYHSIEGLFRRWIVPVCYIPVVRSAMRLASTKLDIATGLPIVGVHE